MTYSHRDFVEFMILDRVNWSLVFGTVSFGGLINGFVVWMLRIAKPQRTILP
jgi:hypothetical protein